MDTFTAFILVVTVVVLIFVWSEIAKIFIRWHSENRTDQEKAWGSVRRLHNKATITGKYEDWQNYYKANDDYNKKW